MKRIKALILGAGCLFAFSESYGQLSIYAQDALLISNSFTPSGSARAIGLGGAVGALGGDPSTANVNPAGLGFYNRSEFFITPMYQAAASDASYLDNLNYGIEGNFSLGQLGVVLNFNKRGDKTDGFLGGSLALTYQQNHSFNRQFSYFGVNQESSFTEVLPFGLSSRDISVLENPADPLDYVSYLSNLLVVFADSDNPGEYFYDSYYPYMAAERDQMGSVERRGSNRQFNIAYGGNISDRFYFGATLGLTSLRLDRTLVIDEYVTQEEYDEANANGEDWDSNYPIYAFTYTENLLTNGSGANITVGAMAKPVDEVTLGVTYRSPTLYSLREEASYFVSAFALSNRNDLNIDAETFGEFEYTLTTPGELTLSSSVMLGKLGLLSADVQFVNFSRNRLSSNLGDLQTDNNEIQRALTNTVNFRLGGEARVDMFRFRVGFRHNGSPYRESQPLSASVQTYSVGAGLRQRNFYIDLAYAHTRNQEAFPLYQVGNRAATVGLENTMNIIAVTAGFNF